MPIPENNTITRPTIKRGETGDYVREAQTYLSILGYYKEPVSGTFDIVTEHAVKSFQVDWNLRIDGIIGPETWEALDRAYGGEPAPDGSGGVPGVINWVQQHKVASVAIVGAIIGGLYLIFRPKKK